MPGLPRMVLTCDEVRQLMGWKSIVTVYTRLKKGTLPFQPIPRQNNRGQIRFSLADVERVLGRTIDIDTLDAMADTGALDIDLEAPHIDTFPSDEMR